MQLIDDCRLAGVQRRHDEASIDNRIVYIIYVYRYCVEV